ncbi:trp operon leader peptide [Streptomyces sp. NPDC058371]
MSTRAPPRRNRGERAGWMTLSSVGCTVGLSAHEWPDGASSEPLNGPVHAVAGPRTSGRVRRMFAHSIQNWWWTAHPAAH